MPKNTIFDELAVSSPEQGNSLSNWLYGELRTAITDGRLKPAMRLPSSRSLAAQYKVARGTVILAFDRLKEEGYIESRHGSGSYVTENLPDQFFISTKIKKSEKGTFAAPSRLSKWGSQISSPFVGAVKRSGQPFEPNQPGLDLFPTALWARLTGSRLRRATHLHLSDGDPAGYLPLRTAVAAHLGSTRGVKCDPEQVVIVSGTQKTLELIARLLLDPGDQVWVEDPGYIGATSAFRSAGAKVVAVPVDNHGMDVLRGQKLAPQARLAYTTPAHEFPLGMSLSLERRLALLKWAQKSGSWIFEDDYDSEYRFVGRPLPALQSLDDSQCVIFAGSFNKMLFPTLRLGYVVLPPKLVDPFVKACSITDRFPPVLNQAVLCDFFTEGYFGQHVRRMREAYAERLAALLKAAEGPLAGLLKIATIQAGMQTAALLSVNVPDQLAAQELSAHGLSPMPLSIFQIERNDINGFLLGFANYKPEVITKSAEILAKVLRGMKPNS